jgi:chemotaxis protein MotB
MNAMTSKWGLALLLITVPPALSGCVSRSDYDALQTQNQQLQAQLTETQAHVGRLQNAIKYTVNSDLLFRPGSWQMSPQGQRIVTQMASKLAPTQQEKLYVNGYTDNRPIGAALQEQGITSNQQLSEKRAEVVMHYLISQGVKPDLVSARGYGEENPVASNATASGRAQNRRVELTLTPE